jgi:YggT family protein
VTVSTFGLILATITTGQAIRDFLVAVSTILWVAILIRALISWFSVDTNSGAIRLLDDICEPIVGPLRRILPPLGSIDISPLVAIILIQVITNVLVNQIH